MIIVKNLVKTYEGRVPTPALLGVSFDIRDGEFVAIMGRSGSGKSTLLHQLGLLDTPTSGTIIINGVHTSGLSEGERSDYRLASLGYVFQEYALIGELTAFENVLLPAMTLNVAAGKDWRRRARELLQLVGLEKRADHYPNQLSGGEQQRVAIARALVNRPKIIFADEPTANLDSDSAKVVLELFRTLRHDLKQTIVMVTHEPDDRRYVDRVIWLKDGRVERQEGKTDIAVNGDAGK